MKAFFSLVLLATSSVFSQSLVVDETFNQANGFSSPTHITSLLELPDGRILVTTKDLFEYNSFSQTKLFVVNEDGIYDSTFSCGTCLGPYIVEHSLLFDQSIIIAGQFLSYNDVEKKLIAKIDFNGNLDESFNTNLFSDNVNNGFIHQISLDNAQLVQYSKIYVSGQANNQRIFIRLNHNGSLDESFIVDSDLDGGDVTSFAILPDGQIIANCHGVGLFRLNSNGSIIAQLDFNDGLIGTYLINSIVPLESGKILLAGNFVFNGEQYTIVRLNQDGSLDDSFLKYNFGFPDDIPIMKTLKIDNERIIAGGFFDSYFGSENKDLVVLNSDGSFNSTITFGGVSSLFGTNYASISCVLPVSDNKIVVGGFFAKVNDVQKKSLARLNLSNLDVLEYDNIDDLITYTDNQICFFESQSLISNIEIYDLAGRLFFSDIVNSYSYSYQFQNNSILLYRLTMNDGKIYTGKMIN